ncbi:MAG: UDP-N-acetylmuramoyl-tripeptide--D-alanyl-D-alanine ligase [Eubacterium sp.]
MKGMTLSNIAKACNGQYIGDDSLKNEYIEGAVIDSRLIEKNYLFIPVAGQRVDGHDFINQVFEKGAICTLSERKLESPIGPYILVESTLKALKDIAAYYRSIADIKVVGITGSVGKTSTKEIISSVLSMRFNVLKTEGNLNNEIGLPLTVLKIREEHEIAVLEMGISDFGEMHRLSSIARPDVCVITNIGTCHLENLGNRDGVFKAKTEVFDHMGDNPHIILNGDDDKLASVQDINGIKPIFFGIDTDRDLGVYGVTNMGIEGTRVNIKAYDKEFFATIPIPGMHMVYNALAATAVGMCFDMDFDEIKRGIEALKPVTGRNNIIRNRNLTIIDDCYNANPMSMKASLDVLSMVPENKIAILGDMFELGTNEQQLHWEIGKYVASKGIDKLVCVGNLSKYMAEAAKQSKDINVNYFETLDKLLDNINSIIKGNETILVKASHGMKFAKVVEILKSI